MKRKWFWGRWDDRWVVVGWEVGEGGVGDGEKRRLGLMKWEW